MNKILWLLLSLIGIYSVSAYLLDPESKGSAEISSLEVVQIGEMTTDRAAHQATLLKNEQVLITGGCAGQGCARVLSSAELYDPVSQSFRLVAPMSSARTGHSAVALSDGRVLVVGGWTGSKATNSAEIYDPTTDQWETVDQMSDARASLISVLLQDSTIFIMGGGDGRLGNLSTAEIYNPFSAQFVKAGESQTNHYLATLLADGRVLMTGGQSDDERILNTAEIFDPMTGDFLETGSMVTPRVKHAAVLLNNGHVMVIGGSDSRGYQGRFSSTEIFDPETGLFSEGPEMQFGRHKIRDAVVKLPSGNVLVAGGARKPEFYDINTKNFIPVRGQLSGPQMFATATLLSNGDVLVLGGYDEQTRTSDTAWIVRMIE
jgi:hypothetical protein